MAEPEDAIWYVGIQGEQKGPFTVEAIKEMIANGEVGQQDMVWNEGMTEWQPVSQTPEFATESTDEEPAAETGAEPKAPAGPNPALEYARKFLADVQKIVADPDEGLKQAAADKSLEFAGCFIVLAIVTAAIYPLYYGAPFGRVLLSAAASPVARFALLLATFAILRIKAGWKEALVFTGLSHIPAAATGLVNVALAWASLRIPAILEPFAVVAMVLILAHLLEHVTEVSRRVVLYTVPLLALVVQAALLLITLV
jgi:hypothetical protein